MSKKKKLPQAAPSKGSLVQVADAVTGVHGRHVFVRKEGDDAIVTTVERPDIELRVPLSSLDKKEA